MGSRRTGLLWDHVGTGFGVCEVNETSVCGAVNKSQSACSLGTACISFSLPLEQVLGEVCFENPPGASMKTSLIAALSIFISVAAQAGHHEAGKMKSAAVIGAPNQLLAGNTDKQHIWVDYIQAHNDRD